MVRGLLARERASTRWRQLVEGKEYLFSDRGAANLKGFEEPVRLFEVRWDDGWASS